MKLLKSKLSLILFLSLSTAFLITSCSSDDDGKKLGDDGGGKTSEFQGTWSGTFTGDDTGTFQISINAAGTISGTGQSTVHGENFTLSGSINSSGEFTASLGSTSGGANFSGVINGNSMSGNWVNPLFGESGTFVGSKDGGSASAFAGIWSGTFTGDDTGTFQININSSGIISGNGQSTVHAENFTLSGSINSSGEFTASLGSTSGGANFSGTIIGNSISGNWVNPLFGESGTFVGSKVQ